MTNHEVIQFLNNMIGEEHGRSIGAEGFYRELCAYHVDALRMAIKALSQQTEDAISRQAVIEYIEGSEAELGHRSENELVCQYIKELPPVIPKQELCGDCISRQAAIEQGKWVNLTNEYKKPFCPNCGARMIEPQESEE